MNGNIEKNYSMDNYVTRDELSMYTKKVMEVAEERARDSERIVLLEEKFDSIDHKLEKLCSTKIISEWVKRSLLFTGGYMVTVMADHFSNIISYLNHIMNA